MPTPNEGYKTIGSCPMAVRRRPDDPDKSPEGHIPRRKKAKLHPRGSQIPVRSRILPIIITEDPQILNLPSLSRTMAVCDFRHTHQTFLPTPGGYTRLWIIPRYSNSSQPCAYRANFSLNCVHCFCGSASDRAQACKVHAITMLI